MMNNLKKLALPLALVFSLSPVFLSACGSDDEDEETNNTPAENNEMGIGGQGDAGGDNDTTNNGNTSDVPSCNDFCTKVVDLCPGDIPLNLCVDNCNNDGYSDMAKSCVAQDTVTDCSALRDCLS